MNTTYEQIISRAESLGLPIAEYEFKATKKNPAPDPPFLIYFSSERQSGTDEKNRIRTITGSLELYTDRKRDPKLETLIEENVLFDIEFQKATVPIQTENMYQAAYDFTVVQKKRKEQ